MSEAYWTKEFWNFKRRFIAIATSICLIAVAVTALFFISQRLSASAKLRALEIVSAAYEGKGVSGLESAKFNEVGRRCGGIVKFRIERVYSSLFGAVAYVEVSCTRARCSTYDVWQIHRNRVSEFIPHQIEHAPGDD
jgi:hypothetical protein